MKSIYKKGALLAAAALMSFALAGCGGSSSGSKTAKDTLTVGVTNFADSLEPTDNYYGWQVMRYGIGECLVHFDDKMNAEPWIAESWKVSDDKMSWTFKIRDIKFSNGKPVTGEAVKKSIERTFAKAPRAKAMFELDHITADGQNVTIYTKKPVATLPGMLGDPLFIIVDTDSDGKVDFAKQGPVCTGPYMVKSFSKAKTELDANPNYYDKVPFAHAQINTIDDPNTRAMALQKGEIDVAVNIAPGDMQLFQDKNKFTISTISSIRDVLARLNVANGKPLADKNVRKALLQSLDRDTYCKVLLKDTFTPGGPLLPPSLDYGFDKLKAEYPDNYNVENAKKLLADAGWKDTDGDGYVDKDGKNLELDFVYYSGRAELPLFAEATQSDAKKVGIKVNLKNVDYNVLDGIGTRGEYDMLISNILTEQAGDPEVFVNMYWKTNVNGSNPQNGSGYSNPEYDALSDQLIQEFDPAKRKEIIEKMEKIIQDDAATLVFGYPQTNMIANKKVKNADIKPCDYYWVTKDIIPAE
ncbi:ABC transporter substrate-binding protein [uncultured Dialister sp.]|uniref:ABC transporter substrate-binding protein n=1 Tax=uncultured Dialister sp. TaxID=278064 RepID=UPI00260A9D28|nr:ABC transporter substrate-binding protein [uncultured Dialister sp.]